MTDLDTEDMEALGIIYKSAGVRRYVYPAFGVDFGSLSGNVAIV